MPWVWSWRMLSQSAQAGLRIEAGAGFVEKQDFGLVRGGASDLDALGQAAGKFADE